jgi:hypothetical protein
LSTQVYGYLGITGWRNLLHLLERQKIPSKKRIILALTSLLMLPQYIVVALLAYDKTYSGTTYRVNLLLNAVLATPIGLYGSTRILKTVLEPLKIASQNLAQAFSENILGKIPTTDEQLTRFRVRHMRQELETARYKAESNYETIVRDEIFLLLPTRQNILFPGKFLFSFRPLIVKNNMVLTRTLAACLAGLCTASGVKRLLDIEAQYDFPQLMQYTLAVAISLMPYVANLDLITQGLFSFLDMSKSLVTCVAYNHLEFQRHRLPTRAIWMLTLMMAAFTLFPLERSAHDLSSDTSLEFILTSLITIAFLVRNVMAMINFNNTPFFKNLYYSCADNSFFSDLTSLHNNMRMATVEEFTEAAQDEEFRNTVAISQFDEAEARRTIAASQPRRRSNRSPLHALHLLAQPDADNNGDISMDDLRAGFRHA